MIQYARIVLATVLNYDYVRVTYTVLSVAYIVDIQGPVGV